MSPGCLYLLVGLAASLPIRGASLGEPSPEEQKLLARMAAQGTNTATLFALGDLCHDAGVEGDETAVLRAESYLRQLLEIEPTNAPALALLGSVYTMKGRDAFWPPTQLRLAREGNKMMDRAVSLAPEDIRTRTIRALNNAHMPEFLGRGDLVRADLAWLWEKIEKEPASFTTSAKQQVALHWGLRLKRMHQRDDARRVWEQGRRFAPESEVASEIAREEAKLR
jgi:hypothetical protein